MSLNTDFIPFARPSIEREEEEAVLRVMRSGWLTTGAEALAFENEFADFVGARCALSVNSATSGLHLALTALGIHEGDTVVTSPYTFTSSAAVVRHCGAELLFCDVLPDSYQIDPQALEAVLKRSKNCRAIIVVHIAGLPCDMDPILDIAAHYDCAVIEDAAHSFPSRTRKGYAGTLGNAGVYSFYATKTITTGEGGMLVTNDERIASSAATMRMHGFDRAAWDRYTSKNKASWQYRVIEAGFKYNMPDILAAIGRVQLKKAERFLSERTRIASLYTECFSHTSALIPPPDGEGNAWHLYIARIKPASSALSRDELIEALMDEGIGSSVHFIPLHVMPYYAKRYGLEPQSFPHAFAMYEHSVSLPIWQGMNTRQAERVGETVHSLLTKGRTKPGSAL